MRETIWNKIFVQLLLFELLCQFGSALVNPIVSNYAVDLGGTLASAGFLAGLSSLASLFLRPFAGLLFGRFPRKALLLLSAIIFAASAALCVLLESLGVLGLSRVIMGAAFVIKSSLVVSFASAVIPRSCVGRGVGMMGLAYIVANAIGPGIGAWIGLFCGYRFTFLVSGGLFLLALALILFLKDPGEGREEDGSAANSSQREGRKRKGLAAFLHFETLPLALVVAFLGLMYGSITALVLLVGDQRGIASTSIFFFVYALMSFALRPFSSRMFDRYGLSSVFLPMALFTCLSFVVLAFAETTFAVAISGVLLACGQGCLYPCLQAESVRCAREEETPLAVNTFYLGADVGMALGPMLSGWAFQAFGSFTMLMLNCAIGGLLVVAYMFYAHYRRVKFGEAFSFVGIMRR